MDAGSDGLSKSTALTVLTILTIVAIVPVWLVKYPPLVDYPMHVARGYLLSLPQNGQGITEFYRANVQPVPNLGMDLIVSQLMKIAQPLAVGKLFLSLIIGLLLTGGFALSCSIHRRATLAALLPMVALYDLWFFMGFANYLFGLGIAFWAVATWNWSQDWPKGRRATVMALFGVALVVCHLMGLFVAVLLILGSSVRIKPMTALLASVGFCGVVFVALFLMHKTPIDWAGRLGSLLFGLSPTVLGLGVIVPILALVKTRPVPIFVPPLVSLLVFALIGPSFAGGTAFTCDRLTLPLLIVTLASLDFKQGLSRKATLMCAAVLPLALLLPLVQWFGQAEESRSVVDNLKVDGRATLATVDLGLRKRPSWAYQRHLADWMIIDQHVFVASNFAKRLQQPMVFQDDYEPWHKFQKNNPLELENWDSLWASIPEMVKLQSELSAQRGYATALYVLVYHPAGQVSGSTPKGVSMHGSGDTWTLLKVD